jgi:16S rRNA (uracil1498-N3)-methyltransferase
LFSTRTVVAPTVLGARAENKRVRWKRIVREAAEQSHRGRLPRIEAPMSFADACKASVAEHDLALLLWEGTQGDDAPSALLSGQLRGLEPAPRCVALLVGPEGGLERTEVALARDSGLHIVTLGPRILRAETASVVAAAIVLSELGEMRAIDEADRSPR